MRRSLFHGGTIRLALMLALPLLAAAPARGVCNVSYIDFGQITTGCARETGYCYVISPGLNSPDSISGSFWSLSTGSPAAFSGDDNGTWADEEAWLQPYGPGSFLAGSWWDSNRIDGCIDGRLAPGKTAEVMVVAVSDQDAWGENGYFAAAAARRQRLAVPQFDFTGGWQRDIALATIPVPQIGWIVRMPPFLIVTVGSPDTTRLAPGFYSDGLAEFHDVILGYRMYRMDRWPSDPPADRRRSSGWVAVSSVTPLGLPTQVSIDCSTTRKNVYLAASLVFDSGFESGHLSGNSGRIVCSSWCATDYDGDGFFTDPECPPWDCDDFDAATHPYAAEVNDGRDNQCGLGEGSGIVDEISGETGFHVPSDKHAYAWRAQAGATGYEVSRSSDPEMLSGCLTITIASTSWSDAAIPDPGGAFHYLVRAVAPHVGSWGTRSPGIERTLVCP